MKRILYGALFSIACVLVFGSCSLNNTTYTFKWEVEDTPVSWDVTLYEYRGIERINSNRIENVKDGYTETFKADRRAERVKVYLKVFHGSKVDERWVYKPFILDKGDNTLICVGNSTTLITREP